jgi:hypothetical protein
MLENGYQNAGEIHSENAAKPSVIDFETNDRTALHWQARQPGFQKSTSTEYKHQSLNRFHMTKGTLLVRNLRLERTKIFSC